MSRIDKALRTWEKGSTLPIESEAVQPFNLEGYTRENETPAVSHRMVTVEDLEKPAAPATTENDRAINTAPVRRKLNSDLEARLVSRASGAVPLEQYRRLAATLHDVQQQQGLRTLMLTSALPAEGKTLTTVNLALTLSESYERRVLLVDADLRWPSVHRMLGVGNGLGLSEVLQGDRFEFAIQSVSARLSVLTAGRPGVTPLAGLTSPRMEALVEQCSKQFDWVLIDTPPVGLLPDAQLLARLTRAVVFVIAAGSTPASVVMRAIAELGNDCIVGTVLNRVNERQIPQSDYYSRYYSDGPSEEDR